MDDRSSDQQEFGSLASCSTVDIPFRKLFSGDKTVELISISRVAAWFKSKESGQLRLPPIQRSFVWRNEQIVNYWDSLMRGYPAGLMMVTRADQGHSAGRNLDNRTETLPETAFHLFDGQQRLLSLLLGLGDGALGDSLRLWVDIGEKPKNLGDRLFMLRMNSTGQPFGYRPEAPNQKISAEDRRNAHGSWPTEEGKPNGKPKRPDVIFNEMAKTDPGTLSSAKCVVRLSYVVQELMKSHEDKIRNELLILAAPTASGAGAAYIDDFLAGLKKALNAEIIVKLVDNSVLKEKDYRIFFARLGQGATRLSDEELTYSLIKNRYPHVHDRVEEIVRGPGRFASEIDLVLGALRVAQTLAPWPEAEEWKKAGRPISERIQSLYVDGAKTTEPYFLSMLPEDRAARCRLQVAIEHLRCGLLYDETNNHCGLPSMLLARLPRDLLDVLLLFTFKRGEERTWEGEDRTTLIAFVLHWLIFVGDDGKAAYATFVQAGAEGWCVEQNSVAALLRNFETAGAARLAPRGHHWNSLFEQIKERGSTLTKWEERFSRTNAPNQASPGEALRVLSTHSELQKRALIWLQRGYITKTFPNYDPTSTHDDDLPFDLDHAIPQKLFGDDWRTVQKRVRVSASDENQFRDLRRTVGDSLGNLRWLAASDNRQRGMRQIEAEDDQRPLDDYIDRDSWNKLISADGTPRTWTGEDVATFQRLIDTRTLSLTKRLMEESGIASLVAIADGFNVFSGASANA
jgi:hypothetical protein